MNIQVKNGEYTPYHDPIRDKYLAKVYSIDDSFFDGKYHNIYGVNKDPYVKNGKGKKYYLKNAEVSVNGSMIYVRRGQL